MVYVSFNQPMRTSLERQQILEVLDLGRTWGGGKFTELCQAHLKSLMNSKASILTSSATDALEMAAILLRVQSGDEVIMPSYTFVSTANAFVIRGATPVFVDVDKNTQLMIPALAEAAVTEKTVAIVPVHYAGNSCDMAAISKIAEKNDLRIVEDAAQAIGSKLLGDPVGSKGDLSCLSFHGTKNIVSGEGGSLNVYNEELVERAFHISEKGTNRRDFVNGKIDKYSWVDQGSSFIPSEIQSAYLWAQLSHLEEITARRLETWKTYRSSFAAEEDLFASANAELPILESINGHLFPLIFQSRFARDRFIDGMAQRSIEVVSHYTALHSSPGGISYGKLGSTMENTDWLAGGLVRLPIWSEPGLPVERVIEATLEVLKTMQIQGDR